ncbi:MAG: type II secretion system protein GspL [Pigmentiphaga sp.]|uniref:type II secretion system protein GspL n=1 Tax=Pigmentiphaga sp. TaxID=1977564 RepID=UPI0029B7D2B8|nr:type II secretion system protein GspL [Pigmentiphaga sp.]MDX3908156.1 type II secretion system protein GspL [Pigmentiphaga sp.]
MKTTLRLELPALPMLHADSRVAFALLDRQHAVQRTGELPLAELAAAVPASRVEGILHPADSVVTSVTVPPLPAHRLSAAVAGAVEPMVLGDIDTLAVAHGARAADGSVPVAWAAREQLARALRLLADCGLPADALIPAPLALSLTESGWTVLTRDEHIVIRTGLQSGLAWTIDPLATTDADPAWASLLPALEQDAPAVLAWIDPPSANWPELPGIEGRELPSAARWQGPALGWSLALPDLQPHRRGRSPWRRPVVWAAGAAAVWLLGLNLHAWQLGREEATLRQRMTTQVRTAFPDIPVVVDPLRQAEQRRDALRAAGGEFGSSDFLPLALAAAQLLPAASNNVTTLRYTSGELRLRLVDEDIGMVARQAEPASPAPPQAQGVRRFMPRRESSAPASPAPAATKMDIDPAIIKRAEGLGVHVARDDGEWIVRSAASTGAEGTPRPGGQAAVRIQQDNPRR